MNAYVRYHKAERWIALILLTLVTCLSVWAYRVDGVGFCVFIALTGALLTAFFGWLGTVADIVSEVGVTRKALFYHRHIPWAQVHRVAAVHMNLGGLPGWYLSVTRLTASGKPQGFLFAYSDALRDALVGFYGPLDVEKKDK